MYQMKKPAPEELVRRLKPQALFSHLDEAALQDVVSCLVWFLVPGGEALFSEGDPGDQLFILLNGRMRASTRSHGEFRVLGEIGPGECVGEMALLTGEPRFATVRAIRDSELVSLKREDFDRLSKTWPETMLQVTRIIVQRLQSSIKGVVPPKNLSNFTVIPANPAVNTRIFCEQLASSLGRFGAADHMSRATFEHNLGREMPNDKEGPRFNQEWLREMGAYERALDYLILECDLSHESWTRLCIRHADCILIVAEGGMMEPDLPNYVWHKIRKANGPRQELVLLHHDEMELPEGSKSLIESLPVAGRHHLKTCRSKDYERLARILTSRATALVLGGGGARGFAHIGVIKAFEDSGIPIDMVGGASMGAIVGAQLAMGWDSEKMREVNCRHFVEGGSLWDYCPPLMALTAGARFDKMGVAMFKDTCIEDLWLPYYCISTSLTHAEMRVHRSGLLRKWVRSSASIPGLIPPFFTQDEALVDGAIFNNVPIDVMEQMEPGRICAVDVTPRLDRSFTAGETGFISPWKILWSRLNPFTPTIKAPSLFSILLRTAMLSSAANVESMKDRAALYLCPPLNHLSMLDWKQMDEAIRLGYEYALEKLKDW